MYKATSLRKQGMHEIVQLKIEKFLESGEEKGKKKGKAKGKADAVKRMAQLQKNSRKLSMVLLTIVSFRRKAFVNNIE